MNWFSFWYSQLQCLRSWNLERKHAIAVRIFDVLSWVLSLSDPCTAGCSEWQCTVRRWRKPMSSGISTTKNTLKMKQKEEEEKLKRQKDPQEEALPNSGSERKKKSEVQPKGAWGAVEVSCRQIDCHLNPCDECFHIVSDRSGDWTSLFVWCITYCAFKRRNETAHRTRVHSQHLGYGKIKLYNLWFSRSSHSS